MNLPLPTCLQELEKLRAEINQAHEHMDKKGEMPLLNKFDQRVAVLCHRIEQSSESIQKECLPVLTKLLDAMDACALAIRSHQPQKMGKP